MGHTLFNCVSCKADQDLKLICKNYPLKSKAEIHNAEIMGWREMPKKAADQNHMKVNKDQAAKKTKKDHGH